MTFSKKNFHLAFVASTVALEALNPSEARLAAVKNKAEVGNKPDYKALIGMFYSMVF